MLKKCKVCGKKQNRKVCWNCWGRYIQSKKRTKNAKLVKISVPITFKPVTKDKSSDKLHVDFRMDGLWIQPVIDGAGNEFFIAKEYFEEWINR